MYLILFEKMVGAAGFEPTTPSPPDWCANRAAPRPDRSARTIGTPLPQCNLGRSGNAISAPDRPADHEDNRGQSTAGVDQRVSLKELHDIERGGERVNREAGH